MIECSCGLCVCSASLGLLVSGSLPNGICERPNVLPWCAGERQWCFTSLVDDEVGGDGGIHTVQIGQQVADGTYVVGVLIFTRQALPCCRAFPVLCMVGT